MLLKFISTGLFSLCLTAVMAAGAGAQTDKRIAGIRAKVSEINKAAPKYKKVKRDVDGISTEGAEAKIYSSRTEVKKIVVDLYGETFNAVSEFYFDGDKLIFAHDRVNSYDTQLGLKRHVKIVRIEQIRSYFDNGKMFRLVKGTKIIASTSSELEEYERQNRETVKGILHAGDRP